MWFPDSEMALCRPFDFQCKYKLDAISRIAKSQGKMEWYKDVRANDMKLQQVLAEYSNRVTDNPVQKFKMPRSSTMQYLECVVCSTVVIVEEHGKMMTEMMYFAFAETLDGGKLTEAQARQQWAQWKEQTEEPDSSWPPSDRKGRDGELRIWVKVEDAIRFQNKMERSKQLMVKHKEV